MKIQKCRRLERDRQTPTPLRPNPKRTESSDQAIQDAEIWRTPARAIEDQQLMFGENGFRDHGAHSAWGLPLHSNQSSRRVPSVVESLRGWHPSAGAMAKLRRRIGFVQ